MLAACGHGPHFTHLSVSLQGPSTFAGVSSYLFMHKCSIFSAHKIGEEALTPTQIDFGGYVHMTSAEGGAGVPKKVVLTCMSVKVT